MTQVLRNLEEYGNTSAGSIPLALTEAVKAGKVKKGDIRILDLIPLLDSPYLIPRLVAVFLYFSATVNTFLFTSTVA